VAELRWRMGDLVGAAPGGRRLAYGLGGVVLMLLASAVLFVIAIFVGFGLGQSTCLFRSQSFCSP
jgi:hypothetical protein